MKRIVLKNENSAAYMNLLAVKRGRKRIQSVREKMEVQGEEQVAKTSIIESPQSSASIEASTPPLPTSTFRHYSTKARSISKAAPKSYEES